MDAPRKYDYTMLSAFLRCRKRYYWRIIRGLIGKVPPTPLDFGKAIHKALDTWHMRRDLSIAIDVFCNNFTENPADNKRTTAVGVKLLQLYAEKYEREPFIVLNSEVTFDLPILDNINLMGRIDKIVDWNGTIFVMDHKTTSRLGYEFFYKIRPNMQFDGYIWAAQQKGYSNCWSILLDALLVAKGLTIPSQLSKLTPLARLPDTRTKEDIDRFVRNVERIVADIVLCYNTDTWYENTESCCDFVECPYRRICKEDGNVQERIIEMDYVIEPWSPLKENGDA